MGSTRRRQRLWRMVVACVSAAGSLAIFGLSVPDATVAAQTGDVRPQAVRTISGPAGTVRADVALRYRQVRVDGQLSRPEAPPVAMRLERQQAQGSWRTTFTFHGTGAAEVKSGSALVAIQNPFLIARIEYDEDTAEARAYDRVGRRVALPTDADRRRFGVTDAQRGAGWDPKLFGAASISTVDQRPTELSAGALYVEGGQRDQRRGEIQRQFGQTVGRIRGFDRFVRTEGHDTRELLVAPDPALPVELNVVRGGSLSSRLQLQYANAGALGYVRHTLHSERSAGPSSPGELVVTDLVLSNIEVATGGGR